MRSSDSSVKQPITDVGLAALLLEVLLLVEFDPELPADTSVLLSHSHTRFNSKSRAVKHNHMNAVTHRHVKMQS